MVQETMKMKIRKLKNPELKRTIQTLDTASRKENKAIWGALAEELDKPKRGRTSVNLSKINRHTEEGDVVAIPGKVLASGFLNHQVTVAAFAFSEGAKKKIVDSGSKAISLETLLEEGINPSQIKILK